MRTGSDTLTVLGSGGGRYMATSQRRCTGGFVLQLRGGSVQVHVDPGPGAITAVHQRGIDPGKTTVVILTHHHMDHEMSMPVIIEAMHGDDLRFVRPRGTLVAPEAYFSSGLLDAYYNTLLERLVAVKDGTRVSLGPGVTARATRAVHGRIPGNGYVITVESEGVPYTVAFTSDTEVFDGYVQEYEGVDVLVANVLRPDSDFCTGHLTTDELVPLLQEIRPKACVLVHFGRKMDNPVTGNKVSSQVAKIQAELGASFTIIGPEDGDVINLPEGRLVRPAREKKHATRLRRLSAGSFFSR